MAADTKSLRNRIRSVDSTLHLTKAMGLVASSKMRRANANMTRGREYAAAMQEVVDVLRASPECARTPYMVPKGEQTCLIVIAGDRGLAGGYNSNILKLAYSSMEGADTVVLPIGKRAVEFFSHKGVELLTHPAVRARRSRHMLKDVFRHLGKALTIGVAGDAGFVLGVHNLDSEQIVTDVDADVVERDCQRIVELGDGAIAERSLVEPVVMRIGVCDHHRNARGNPRFVFLGLRHGEVFIRLVASYAELRPNVVTVQDTVKGVFTDAMVKIITLSAARNTKNK